MYTWGLWHINVQVLYAEAPDSDNLVFCYIGKHPDLCYSVSTMHIPCPKYTW